MGNILSERRSARQNLLRAAADELIRAQYHPTSEQQAAARKHAEELERSARELATDFASLDVTVLPGH